MTSFLPSVLSTVIKSVGGIQRVENLLWRCYAIYITENPGINGSMNLFKRFLLRHPILLRSAMLLRAKRNHATLAIVRHVKRAAIVYDVGANVGAFAGIFAVVAGRGGRVFCFEPVSANFEKLKKAQQSFPRIMPY